MICCYGDKQPMGLWLPKADYIVHSKALQILVHQHLNQWSALTNTLSTINSGAIFNYMLFQRTGYSSIFSDTVTLNSSFFKVQLIFLEIPMVVKNQINSPKVIIKTPRT